MHCTLLRSASVHALHTVCSPCCAALHSAVQRSMDCTQCAAQRCAAHCVQCSAALHCVCSACTDALRSAQQCAALTAMHSAPSSALSSALRTGLCSALRNMLCIAHCAQHAVQCTVRHSALPPQCTALYSETFSALRAVQSIQCSELCDTVRYQYTVQYTALQTVNCALCTACCALHSTVQCSAHCAQCSLFSAVSTAQTVLHCAQCSAQCTVQGSEHCTGCTAECRAQGAVHCAQCSAHLLHLLHCHCIQCSALCPTGNTARSAEYTV